MLLEFGLNYYLPSPPRFLLSPYLGSPLFTLPLGFSPCCTVASIAWGLRYPQSWNGDVTIIQPHQIVKVSSWAITCVACGLLRQAFACETAEHAFDHGIIPTIPFPTHTPAHLLEREQRVIGVAGLTPPIGVVQQLGGGCRRPNARPPLTRYPSWRPLPSQRPCGKTDPRRSPDRAILRGSADT